MLRNRSNPRLGGMLCVLGLAASMSDATRAMKVNSPILNEWSGKLGGAVGFTTRFGMMLRGLVTGSNPETGPQFIVRGILASLASYWRSTLTALERATWTNLSEDTPGSASGLTLFVRANSERVRAAATIVESAPGTTVADFSQLPVVPTTTDPGALLENDGGDLSVAFTLPANGSMVDPWAIVTGGIMNVYLSRPQRATRSNRIKPFVFLDTLLGNTTSGSRAGGLHTIDLSGAVSQAILDAFASLDVGDVCYVKFTTVTADGRRSQDFVQRLTCGAP